MIFIPNVYANITILNSMVNVTAYYLLVQLMLFLSHINQGKYYVVRLKLVLNDYPLFPLLDILGGGGHHGYGG